MENSIRSSDKIEQYFQNLDNIERFTNHCQDIKFMFDDIYSDKSCNLKIPIYQASHHMFKVIDCNFSPGSFYLIQNQIHLKDIIIRKLYHLYLKSII